MSKGTTKRGIRIDDDLWDQVRNKAEQEGVVVSELIRGLLREWLKNERA